MGTYQRNQIEAIAKQVNILANQQDKACVDVIAIAKTFGLTVNEVEFGDRNISGMIEYDKRIISIESRDPYTKKRFSVGHEIGHYVLHYMLSDNPEKQEVSYRASASYQSYSPKEIEADHFSTTLLMPEASVRDLWEQYRDVDDVANQLRVSVSALCFRLEYLGLI